MWTYNYEKLPMLFFHYRKEIGQERKRTIVKSGRIKIILN